MTLSGPHGRQVEASALRLLQQCASITRKMQISPKQHMVVLDNLSTLAGSGRSNCIKE